MRVLDVYYVQLLHVGFIVLRQAVDANDKAWVAAELEFLHNVPSLIGEANTERHRYFWSQERTHYSTWIEEHGSERAKSRVATYYAPILREMESAMAEHLAGGKTP